MNHFFRFFRLLKGRKMYTANLTVMHLSTLTSVVLTSSDRILIDARVVDGITSEADLYALVEGMVAAAGRNLVSMQQESAVPSIHVTGTPAECSGATFTLVSE